MELSGRPHTPKISPLGKEVLGGAHTCNNKHNFPETLHCRGLFKMLCACNVRDTHTPGTFKTVLVVPLLLCGGYYCLCVHIAIFSFLLRSSWCFLSLIYSRNSALNAWRSNIRCDTFTLAPRWRGSLRDRVNVVEYIGTMVLYVWSTNALLQLTSLMTDVNSLCKSSFGWAQSSCWQTAWMNHVPETSR